jgi:acyl-CoA synthetase (NDP forming)
VKQLDFSEAEKILKKYRIKTPNSTIVKKREEAAKAAKKLGFPVVMKIISPDIIHKTEKKAVMTGILDEAGAERAFDEIKKRSGKARFKGILVQQQVEGKEVIIGGKTDAQFGPIVLFGIGGIFVEIMKDVSLRIAPIEKSEALEMIKEIKSYPILAGARGEKPVNLAKLAEMISAVSKMISNNKINELDLNPVIVSDKECVAVDIRMMV